MDICKSKVSHFRVFKCVCYKKKCVCYPSGLDHLRSKFNKKAVHYIFVGYDDQRKGYKCCDLAMVNCYTSRNVVFDELSSRRSLQDFELPNS
ncbi:hypothetical protein BT93_A0114 [Corymbia citriodora subsp. variegata]|nr:hypothetical protein BT93_A0114 [Corymbia citriodora subsp. variegata]